MSGAMDHHFLNVTCRHATTSTYSCAGESQLLYLPSKTCQVTRRTPYIQHAWSEVREVCARLGGFSTSDMKLALSARTEIWRNQTISVLILRFKLRPQRAPGFLMLVRVTASEETAPPFVMLGYNVVRTSRRPYLIYLSSIRLAQGLEKLVLQEACFCCFARRPQVRTIS